MRDRSGSLLLVDDNLLNLDLLSRRLERKGYHVQTAESGAQALTSISKGGLDLVLLDVEMPGMSGLEVLTQIRRSHSRLQLPVIMVTARSDSEDIVMALELGANDYITKPIDLPVAAARITTHLSLKWTEQALHESEERYALAARGANDGLWDWDVITDEVYFSARWKELLGFGEHEIGNRIEDWFSRVHPEDVDGLRTSVRDHLEKRTHHLEHEHRITHRDGAYRWMVARGLAVWDESGQATRMAGSQRDVTQERIADPLTGLPNRVLFLDRLGCLLERAARQKDYIFGVLSLAVDRIQVINNSLGRATGDKLLVALSKRLESSVRSSDTLARFGGSHTVARISGDRFSILLDDIKSPANASRVAERILEMLTQPFKLGTQEIFASAWIGITFNTPGHTKPEEFLRDADTAINWARLADKSRYEVYDPSMRSQALMRLELETELRRALERQELQNNYQIIVSTKTREIVGFESLVRWYHPTKGVISPGEFIPLAEETGLILEIDHQQLRTACHQLRAWHERFRCSPPWLMCINLSARQFMTTDLVERIAQVVKDSGLDARNLKMEVTESLMMQDMEVACTVLQQLKSLGLQVAIDDFGTGYSSLSYLHQFPVDTLKIDQSFVGQMGTDGENSSIVTTIISLAHNLGLDVVAEGVETAEQFRQLEKLGCEYVQGYYFAKPMPKAKMEEFLEAVERDARPWKPLSIPKRPRSLPAGAANSPQSGPEELRPAMVSVPNRS
jgi:diguanylate cyclase (GGDEF)-like protein/PAS domain S-box-containing protein